MNANIILSALVIGSVISFAACNYDHSRSKDSTQITHPDIGSKITDIPQVIQDFISRKYPDATLRKYEKELNGSEVDIVDNGKQKEVYFDSKNQWLSTEWSIRSEEVPPAIINTLIYSTYNDYDIKEVDAIEKPAGMFYAFDLKQFNNEVSLQFNAEGQLIK